MSFLDVLRQMHPEIQQPKPLIADVIDFVSSQESLGTRPHLRRIFRLSCLSLDDPRMSFAPVKFGSYRTDDPSVPCLMLLLHSVVPWLPNTRFGRSHFRFLCGPILAPGTIIWVCWSGTSI